MAEMVTRTVITTEVTVLGVDEVTAEPRNETYVFKGKIKQDKLMPTVNKANKIDKFHPAYVVSYEYKETLLGVPLEKFIEIGVPVTRPASQQKKETA